MPAPVTAILTFAGSVLIALLVVASVHRVVARIGHRSALFAGIAQHLHRPALVVAVLVAVQFSLGVVAHGDWRPVALHVVGIALILAGAWLLAALLVVIEDATLARIRVDVSDNRHARRVHTQITLVRRVTVVVVGVLAASAVLMTFPSARAAGTSLLASAGVIGAIAALAAQSLLGNVFAGVQIAFSDALRLDDVVIVEKEWGRIEDITLTYVVVHLWDDRRLILPTSYFLRTPFQNWTRTQSALLGTVELDVDWTVPVEDMRQELRRVLEGSDLWDGRVSVLQVTEAVNAFVRVRALVSASDAGHLWDLRCLVREHLVNWLRQHHPAALPQVRLRELPRTAGRTTNGAVSSGDNRVFGDSPDGEERVQAFSGPDQQRG
ncbi:mechanosensitive ion channel family protein [Saccharothrix coeruleofusca]|uniref:Mechanosensitive ion channel protein MscS n=1 Tax=Saccharothrix coeruleofusca TaxID=33919 RepID=A0A918ATT0_9PSEU|nr:mechanosensitive ion channel domain-containing protein [Saccharothrix coeruleofusca]MBP2338942.1 small-conductance mechanosensitive channel [Saccharothrix coeruleofusca]GGP83300.1 mechanosensitive ion channel protein MscS [Saccharothrix coeruleofusca]